jgi:probable rRNA maturation factor
MNPILIETDIQSQPWNKVDFDLGKTIDNAISATSKMFEWDAETIELSLVLCDNSFIQNLNKQYRGKDKPTNVLSFPQNEPQMLGDIIIAYETILTEAAAQDKTLRDHFTHMLVHGFLHLCGHDHEEDSEAVEMEALEVEILQSLNIKNPYLDDENM